MTSPEPVGLTLDQDESSQSWPVDELAIGAFANRAEVQRFVALARAEATTGDDGQDRKILLDDLATI